MMPALFLHIQKTAGTSLVKQAQRFYGASLISHGGYVGKELNQLRDIGFVSGHFGYHFAQHLMPGRFTFTFLRDPAERVLSMYYFCRNRNPDQFEIYRKARELTLPDFLEAGLTNPCIRRYIWNNQVWQLAHGFAHLDNRAIDDFSDEELVLLAKKHLGQFSFVGFTETFDTDATAVMKALRFPKIKLQHLNANPEQYRAAELAPELRVMLDKLTQLDRALYDYARKEFQWRNE